MREAITLARAHHEDFDRIRHSLNKAYSMTRDPSIPPL